jgi:type II secretory pathway pseudopilin PulG
VSSPSSSAARRAAGFTYVGLLIAVALLSIGLAGAGEVWSTAARREREAQLLFAGDQFRRALDSYYEGSPGVKRYPTSLEALLEDRRLPTTRRHLRRLYADPMTGKPDWALVRLPGGEIVGVHSVSTDRPLKRAGFGPSDEAFGTAESYRQWVFRPVTRGMAGQQDGNPAGAGTPATPSSTPGRGPAGILK